MTSAWRPAGDRELRVGLAGLGSMGRNHLRILSGRSDIRRPRSPIRSSRARSATGLTGAQGFAEPLAMIAEADLDAVVIAAPTTAHVPLALAAIERGMAVLVEKPLAATVDEAMRIVVAARAAGVPVQVGHVERFNPAVLELGRLIDSRLAVDDLLDRIATSGPVPRSDPRRRRNGRPRDARRRHPQLDRRRTPARVYAETAQRIHATNEDLLFGLLHFPSGATGMLDVNWFTPAKRRQLVVGEASPTWSRRISRATADASGFAPDSRGRSAWNVLRAVCRAGR